MRRPERGPRIESSGTCASCGGAGCAMSVTSTVARGERSGSHGRRDHLLDLRDGDRGEGLAEEEEPEGEPAERAEEDAPLDVGGPVVGPGGRIEVVGERAD